MIDGVITLKMTKKVTGWDRMWEVHGASFQIYRHVGHNINRRCSNVTKEVGIYWEKSQITWKLDKQEDMRI